MCVFFWGLFKIHEMTFRWKVWKSHVLVRPIKLCRRKLSGRHTLIVYSLAVNLQVHGVLEGLLSLILKAKSRIKLTFACIESRMVFVMTLFVPLFSSCRKFQSVYLFCLIIIFLSQVRAVQWCSASGERFKLRHDFSFVWFGCFNVCYKQGAQFCRDYGMSFMPECFQTEISMFI
jgi:hypothetical protein